VRGGSRLVADAANRLAAMLEAAQSSNALMGGIARDSQDQAASIYEVNGAVRTLDEMTQHNAALVEETSASIEQTEAQASELDRIVEVFTLSGEALGEAAPDRLWQEPATPRAAAPAPGRAGIRNLPGRVKAAADRYLASGNTAIDKDWEEF
jgi:methyl-accepting chemotaxis protein